MPATASTLAAERASPAAESAPVADAVILNSSNAAMPRLRAERQHLVVDARTASAASSASAGSRSRPPRQRPRAAARSSPRDDDEIDVAIELQVLKPVVEHVDGGAEVALGERPAR